jgi:drug/metabolite transporter (DMT)-like permease
MRTTIGLGAMVTGFLGYSLLPLGDAVALEQSGPIFLTALSVPLLGERVGVRRWSAVIVGFVGVLIMTRPGAGVFNPAALLSLSAALLYAVAMIAIRKMSRSEAAATIVFYFTLIGAIAGALSLPFQWHWPDGPGLLVLVGVGLLGGGAQITMTLAFRLAPVALLAPFGYAGLVFAMGFGYVIWGEVPDAYLLLGAAIVVASGLYILHRETTLARRRTLAAPAPV